MHTSNWRNQRHAIECCKDCKPPKRYPGCGDHCPEYKKEKAKYQADMKRKREYLRNHPPLSNHDFDRVRVTASRKK